MAKTLCDTKGMTEKQWLACRGHGPNGDIDVTLGGSDVAAALGISPWKTPLELWMEKRGQVLPAPPNPDQLRMGHMLEPIVGQWYAIRSGNTLVEDTYLYQHDRYPFALANIDYRAITEDGHLRVVECKSTTYRKAGDWAEDRVPPYYEAQVRFYLGVLGYEKADIACLWGNNPENDFVIRTIDRDLALEDELFKKLAAFVRGVRENRPPTMRGVEPELALKALARMLGDTQSQPTLRLPSQLEQSLLTIARLQDEIRTMDRRKRDHEKEIDALSVEVVEQMGKYEHGELVAPQGHVLVDFVPSARTGVDSKRLEKDYPQVYAAVRKKTVSRKLKVRVESVQDAAS